MSWALFIIGFAAGWKCHRIWQEVSDFDRYADWAAQNRVDLIVVGYDEWDAERRRSEEPIWRMEVEEDGSYTFFRAGETRGGDARLR